MHTRPSSACLKLFFRGQAVSALLELLARFRRIPGIPCSSLDLTWKFSRRSRKVYAAVTTIIRFRARPAARPAHPCRPSLFRRFRRAQRARPCRLHHTAFPSPGPCRRKHGPRRRPPAFRAHARRAVLLPFSAGLAHQQWLPRRAVPRRHHAALHEPGHGNVGLRAHALGFALRDKSAHAGTSGLSASLLFTTDAESRPPPMRERKRRCYADAKAGRSPRLFL